MRSFFAENQRFAEYIVQNNYQHIGNNFHEHIVPVEDVHCQPHDKEVQYTGEDTASKEAECFKDKSFQRAASALEYKQLVGDECKNNGEDPGDNSAGDGAPVEQIGAHPVGGNVDHGCQTAENQI